MKAITKGSLFPLVCLLTVLAACLPDVTPTSQTPTSAGVISSTPVPPTELASDPAPSTPNLTETARASFGATSNAISAYLATQGIPPDQIGQYSQATLDALGLISPTSGVSTATPFPVPFPVSTSVDQSGVTHYAFTDPTDIRSAQQVYERYLEFVSFQTAPPPDNLDEELAQYISADSDKTDAESPCGYYGILGKMMGLAQQGFYVRLTIPDEIKWNESAVYLFVLPGDIEVVMDTNRMQMLMEQIEVATGKVVKETTTSFAASARLDYDWNAGRWLLTLDQRGFYCQGIDFFIAS